MDLHNGGGTGSSSGHIICFVQPHPSTPLVCECKVLVGPVAVASARHLTKEYERLLRQSLPLLSSKGGNQATGDTPHAAATSRGRQLTSLKSATTYKQVIGNSVPASSCILRRDASNICSTTTENHRHDGTSQVLAPAFSPLIPRNHPRDHLL